MLRNVRDILSIIVSILCAKELIQTLSIHAGYDGYGYFMIISILAIGILTIVEHKISYTKKQNKANRDKKFKIITLK